MREQLDALVTMADGAMIVVTAATDEQRGGCLVGFHSQSSIDPWRYTVHISKANHTYGVALEATHLLVHFLDEQMRDTARVFGTLTDDGHLLDKFALVEWEPAPDARTPLLRGVDNWLLGRVLRRLGDVGDLHAGHPA